MKRIPIVLLLVLALLFVSCDNEEVKTPESNDDSGAAVVEKGLVTIDLSDLKSGQSITKTVTGDVEFQLEGLDFSDGVVIIDGDFIGASKSIGRSIGENDSLFKREDGTFIPVPDENKMSRFLGSDINILDLTTLHFKKLKLDDDFSISLDEYPGRVGVEEEFYYLDFLNPKWRNLDKSEVVFWLHNMGHYGLSAIHWGLLGKEHNPKMVFDFSDPIFFFGLGIDLYAVLDKDSPDQNFNLYVLSPIKLELNKEIQINGDQLVNVFKVLASENKGDSYKAVLRFSPEDYSKLDYRSLHVCARYYNGSLRDDELVPFFIDSSSTVELEIGRVYDDFIFTLDLSYGEDVGFSSISIELVESEKKDIYEDLKTGESKTFKAYDDSNKQTVAFKTSDRWPVEIEWAPNVVMVEQFFSGNKNSFGTGFSHGSITLEKNVNYCFIVEFKDGYKPQKEDTLFTISPREYTELKCDVKYNGKGDYLCEGCENCEDEGFLLEQIKINENGILKGAYWTSVPLDEKYGKVGYINGNRILTDSSIALNSTTTGNLGHGPFGTLAMDKDNVNNSIDVRVIEIHPRDKEIVADVKIDDGKTYYNVVMKYEHYHLWNVNDDETVKCCECGEIRYSAGMEIKAGIQYIMDSNEDFSIWLEEMPEEEFHYKAGNGLMAPVAPVGLSIRLIAPAVDKHISYKANVSHVTIIVQ